TAPPWLCALSFARRSSTISASASKLCRLPARTSADQMADHFAGTYGVRVDLGALDVLPAHVRLSLAGARPPEPAEAALLDRVLQVVPAPLLKAVDRLLIVDTGETG